MQHTCAECPDPSKWHKRISTVCTHTYKMRKNHVRYTKSCDIKFTNATYQKFRFFSIKMTSLKLEILSSRNYEITKLHIIILSFYQNYDQNPKKFKTLIITTLCSIFELIINDNKSLNQLPTL